MKRFTRAYDLPRDQIENSELVAKEAAEPMPKNVLDFKNHPYYALERHLKRSEVIHPKREVGKIAVGRSGGKQILEQVFRRRDVQVVKSGDSWYRSGREVKVGFYHFWGLLRDSHDMLLDRRTASETGSDSQRQGSSERT